jgi:serine/threonine protein kinase
VLYALKIVRESLHLKIEKEGLRRVIDTHHAHVLRRYFYRVWQGALLIITELAEESLEQHFARLRPASPLVSLCTKAIWLLRDAADALDYLAAEKNLMHLDIKPSNLLLVGGRCKLADFGTVMPCVIRESTEVALSAPGEESPDDIATMPYRRLDEMPSARAIRRGATLYTAGAAWTQHFAAPERFLGQFSRSSDQYSLALTFCELTAGRIPFQAKREDQFAARQDGVMTLEFLPGPLHPVIRRALSPRPSERFGSCLEFIAAMREALMPVVEDADALAYLADARDGGKWPDLGADVRRNRLPSPASEKEETCDTDKEFDRGNRPVKRGRKANSATAIGLRLRKVLAGPIARMLSLFYVGARLVERLVTGSSWIKEFIRAAIVTRQGTILIALSLLLACLPVAILVDRIERISPLEIPWTGNDSQPGQHPPGAVSHLLHERER